MRNFRVWLLKHSGERIHERRTVELIPSLFTVARLHRNWFASGVLAMTPDAVPWGVTSLVCALVELEERDTRKVGQREEKKHVKYAVCCWWSRIKRQLEHGGEDQSSIYT